MLKGIKNKFNKNFVSMDYVVEPHLEDRDEDGRIQVAKSISR